MVTSFRQSLIEQIEKFREKMLTLLERSDIGPSVNTENSSFVLIGPDRPWRELSHESKSLQTEIYNRYQYLLELGKAFITQSLPEAKDRFDQEAKPILEMIEQKYLTWHKTIEEAKASFGNGLDKQVEVINSVHGNLGIGRVLIPDTNVFIANPNLHEYKINEKCSILALPTILGELDKLKVEHRNENVRSKAETAIRNTKEYRRRGNLLDGVKITDRIIFYTVAIEPRFEGKPTWLDSNNKDDRFLASCFEVAAKFPDSDIAILTLDINMQNKADFASFPYLDPKEAKFF